MVLRGIMEINIHSGQRVLYKNKNQWKVGILQQGNATINEKGLFLFIIPIEFIDMSENEIPYVHDAEIHDIFFDSWKVEPWMKEYGQLMTKEDYIDFIDSDDFDKKSERAYVSDGDYYYYAVNKFSATWLERQPFDYIVRCV